MKVRIFGKLRLFAVFTLSLSVVCCSILESGKPARQVYLLQTPSSPNGIQPAPDAPNLIISVRAVPGLDTDRILVLGHEARLAPVANAHWPDHLPEVFTSLTRRYLSDLHQFQSVREGSIARPGEWLLELELQAFYGVQSAASVTSSVLLQLEGLLRCGDTKKLLHVSEQASVSAESLSSLVAAHQQVIDAALPALSSKLSEACVSSATH